MNRTKVTVACKACQKKKVKCTGISPCTNCIRGNQRCEFTGTAKKRGPRNGNVEVIKSTARRLENALQENPEFRQLGFEQMLAYGQTHTSARSGRPSPVIPIDAPIVIINDNTGVTTDASQSHGIPRSISTEERYGHGMYSLDNEHAFLQQTSSLRKPIPVYPMIIQHDHVQTVEINSHNGSNKIILPPISELSPQPDINQQNIETSPSKMMKLPIPNRVNRKNYSMPMHSSSGIEVLLPAAPDLANPLYSAAALIKNQYQSKSSSLDLPVTNHNKSTFASSMPSPPSSESPISTHPEYYNKKPNFCNPPTPTNSSPPLSPRNASILSRPVAWESNHNDGFSRNEDMEVDRVEYR